MQAAAEPRWRKGSMIAFMKCALAVSIGFLIFPRLAAADDRFDVAAAKARALEASEQGQAYAKPLFENLEPALQRSMKECFPKADATDAAFSLVFAVHESGKLSEFMVRPESPGAACLIKGIERVKVAAPPRKDWWVVLDVKVTP
jgi:hypothetical protein